MSLSGKKGKKGTAAILRTTISDSIFAVNDPTATNCKNKLADATWQELNETRFAPNCPGVGGGVGRHYPAPEFARWTWLAQTREVAGETSRRNMVRPLIRRVRWAGSHASSRARARGRGRARARSVV
jgi:hypothetical protein